MPTLDHFVAVDLETTGTLPRTHGVVEISVHHPASGRVENCMVHPEDAPVTEEAQGIWERDLSFYKTEGMYAATVDGLLTDTFSKERVQPLIPAGINVHFDVRFIRHHFPHFAELLSDYKWLDLTGFFYGHDLMWGRFPGETRDEAEAILPREDKHTALGDAKWVSRVLQLISQRGKSLPRFDSEVLGR